MIFTVVSALLSTLAPVTVSHVIEVLFASPNSDTFLFISTVPFLFWYTVVFPALHVICPPLSPKEPKLNKSAILVLLYSVLRYSKSNDDAFAVTVIGFLSIFTL